LTNSSSHAGGELSCYILLSCWQNHSLIELTPLLSFLSIHSWQSHLPPPPTPVPTMPPTPSSTPPPPTNISTYYATNTASYTLGTCHMLSFSCHCPIIVSN
jgi:hypothetical protein